MILLTIGLFIGMLQLTQTIYEHQPASHTQSVQNAREVDAYQGNTLDGQTLQPTVSGKSLQLQSSSYRLQ